MSFSSLYTLDNTDGLATTNEHDYTSVVRRSSQELEDSNVESLTTLAGRHMVHEASSFFEELQADLSSIYIPGDNADELWCLLDWHRYILAVWTQLLGMASHVPESKWVSIKESLETIIKAAVALNLRHARPSMKHQRSDLQVRADSLSFERPLLKFRYCTRLRVREQKAVESIVTATREEAWATPLVHEAAFTGLIDSVIDNIVQTRPLSESSMWRCSSIQWSEFAKFVEILHEELELLVDLLPIMEQDDLFGSLERGFRTALEYDNHNIRSLQFYNSLISTWPVNNPGSQLSIDETFQERVQGVFGRVVSETSSDQYPSSTDYTVQDLQDIMALGADVRGEVHGRKDCVLWAAASSGTSLQIFKALVYAGAPYVQERSSGAFPLQAAASAGRLDIVEFLLARERHHLDIDINDSDREGKTALHSSVEGCNTRVIDLLLQQPGIDADPRDINGETPFLSAVTMPSKRRGIYAVIKRLMQDKRVDCDLALRTSANALHLAASLRDATLKVIIKRVQGINDQQCHGWTPLHYAVECNSKPNIEVLLNHGADPTIANSAGLTPLLLACSKRHLGPMEILLSLRDSLSNQWAPNGRSASHFGAQEYWSPVTFLLRDIADIPRRGRAHVGLALSMVLAAKPDLEVRDVLGRSILNQVIQKLDEGMLEQLLRAGADPNSQDNTGQTALHRVIRPWSCDWKKLKLLLERGADPDIEDKNGLAAVPADLERNFGRGEKDIINYIKKHRRSKLERSLQVLAEQTKAYTTKQKQKNNEGRKVNSASNPFSVLTVEGVESVEDAEEFP